MKKYKSEEIFEFDFNNPDFSESVKLFKLANKDKDYSYDDFILEVLGTDDKFHICEKHILNINGRNYYSGVCKVMKY